MLRPTLADRSILDTPLVYTAMPASVKPAINPLLAGRLGRLRLQAMASQLAPLVGRNIARARKEQGKYNQRQLAEELRRLEPQYAPANTSVSEWERGVRKPSDRYMNLLAQVLEKPVDWFLRDHDQPMETPTIEEVLPVPEFAQVMESIKTLGNEVRLLRAEAAERDAEALKRIAALRRAIRPPRRGQQQ